MRLALSTEPFEANADIFLFDFADQKGENGFLLPPVLPCVSPEGVLPVRAVADDDKGLLSGLGEEAAERVVGGSEAG